MSPERLEMNPKTGNEGDGIGLACDGYGHFADLNPIRLQKGWSL